MRTLQTIVLIDALEWGHHSTYLKLFSKTLLGIGCRVLAFGPAPVELRQWVAENCPKHDHNFHASIIQEPSRNPFAGGRCHRIYATLARWYVASRAVRYAKRMGSVPDLVFFGWMDSYLHYVSPLVCCLVPLIFPYRWSGLYFHPGQFRQPVPENRKWARNRHALFRSSFCQAAAVLDEGVVSQMKGAIGGKNVIAFPDVADASPPDTSYQPAREIAAKAAGRTVVGIIGSLQKRKGVLTLLSVAQKAKCEEVFFVFAGPLAVSDFSPEELARLHDASGQPSYANCYFHLESIPGEAQFNAVIAACDILFAAYEGFLHSSNLLTKAAIFEKPVIVSNGYCMAERVRKHRIGLVITEGDVSECIEAINRLSRKDDFHARIGIPDFAGYRRLHSMEKLQMAFRELLAATKR